MNTAAEGKKLSRLTNPGPDAELQKILEGSNFEDYKSPLFIAWQINSACNLGCLHCCEEAGHCMPGEMTKEEALDFCRQTVEMDVGYMAISGGEPLLCRHIFDVCEFLRDKKVSLKIETNGEFIDKKVAHRLADLKLRSVQISMDGATAQAHEKLRLRGDWKKVVTSCKMLVKNGVITEIVFVPTRFNIHEISDAIDLAASMGVYGFYTGKIMRIGRAAQNWDILCASDDEYAKFFEVLGEKEAAYQGKMKIYYYPYDVIEELKYRLESPSASLLVLPDGKVKLAGPLPFICGDLKKQSLRQVWQCYKKAWEKPEVIEFTNRVVAEPKLLAESNRWRDLEY
ncbi:MAG: radical SAM protein [Planctomycetota bacterium]|jgi:MoaA/NifB/PqqE/SkfB family radical SAM enzyme